MTLPGLNLGDMDDWPWHRNHLGGLMATWPVPGRTIVGARFRNCRIKAGLSQRRLAELAGVSQSTISRLERGLVLGMRFEAAMRIAAAIGPSFPFGNCPHHQVHNCGWPFDPRPDATKRVTRIG